MGWNGSDYIWVTNVSGASNLNGLSDVTIASLADNQLLQYNTSTSKWENVNLSSLGLITGVTASTGLSGGGSSGSVSLSLSASGVTAGTYTNADITVDLTVELLLQQLELVVDLEYQSSEMIIL